MTTSQKVYYVTGWYTNTLIRQFGIFSSKVTILPLFEKFFQILPLELFNRKTGMQNDRFRVVVQEIELDKPFWYDEIQFGKIVFDSNYKTELEIRKFCNE